MLQRLSKRLVLSSTTSLSRLAKEKVEVAKNVDASLARERIDKVTRPRSLSATVRKAGFALIAAPEPLTGIPGVALVASSYVVKRRDPTNLGHLAEETRKILHDIQSFSV